MTGSGHDYVVFADSAAKAALTAVPIALGDVTYPANGIPGVGTLVYPKEDCEIIGMTAISEAIANLDEYRMHVTRDPDWNRTSFNKRDQTGNLEFEQLIAPLKYQFIKGDSLTVELDNDTNAELNSVGIFIDKNGGGEISGRPFGPLPDKCHLVQVSATITNVVDQWGEGPLTFVNFNLDREKNYRVLGGKMFSVTGHHWRMVALGGVDKDNKPGGPMSDTETCGSMIYWKPYGIEFSGLQGLNLQTLASATDSAQLGVLIIQEI